MVRAAVLAVLLLGALLAGCIGTDGEQIEDQSSTTNVVDPDEANLPDVIVGFEHLVQATMNGQTVSGAGIWIHGDHAYVSGLGSGFHVVDISDPEDPRIVGHLTGDEIYSRDADLLTYDDGRLVAVLATQSGGMTFVDVTEPTDPTIVTVVDIDPNHNVAVVPDTKIVYNSPSGGAGMPNEIIDASVPEQARVVGEFGEHGCHDISFFVGDDGETRRAYCAGVQMSEIWDIADPLEPKLVASVSNPCMDDDLGPQVPRSNCGGLHHSAFVNEDASILILGDEFQGGGGPGCALHLQNGDTSVSSPIGALWFYDVTDETNPELLGWYSPPPPVQNHVSAVVDAVTSNPTAPQGAAFAASCTSHFGEVIPGHDMVIMGWYHAGVLLIDFSDPTSPITVDQWNPVGVDVWDAQLHNGYIFTGDIFRGLDVLRIIGQ